MRSHRADMAPIVATDQTRVLRVLSQHPTPACTQCLEVLTAIDQMFLRDVIHELAALGSVVVQVANCALCTFPGRVVRLPKA